MRISSIPEATLPLQAPGKDTRASVRAAELQPSSGILPACTCLQPNLPILYKHTDIELGPTASS